MYIYYPKTIRRELAALNNNIHISNDNSTYVYNLNNIDALYATWISLFPNIKPYYAIKCNPNKNIIKRLAACGANFDCASAAEIERVISVDIPYDRILYANPCKKLSEIKYALGVGVNTTTFDSICELDKLASVGSCAMNIILRIYANDPTAQCVLSNKFGALENEWDAILTHVKSYPLLNLMGISFHIGSGACNPDAFTEAIKQSRKLYDKATITYGFNINIIDIGGGFTASNIDKMAAAINTAVKSYFSSTNVQIIAEPGRYFAETTADLYTPVIGVRVRDTKIDYTLTDSLYGSFNCVLYDHIELIPIHVKNKHGNGEIDKGSTSMYISTLWGPTCDGFDKICDDILLPKLQYGDYLLWKHMGAYTIAGACDFNGVQFTKPKEIYI
jgi:ornithine decarboxylase